MRADVQYLRLIYICIVSKYCLYGRTAPSRGLHFFLAVGKVQTPKMKQFPDYENSRRSPLSKRGRMRANKTDTLYTN